MIKDFEDVCDKIKDTLQIELPALLNAINSEKGVTAPTDPLYLHNPVRYYLGGKSVDLQLQEAKPVCVIAPLPTVMEATDIQRGFAHEFESLEVRINARGNTEETVFRLLMRYGRAVKDVLRRNFHSGFFQEYEIVKSAEIQRADWDIGKVGDVFAGVYAVTIRVQLVQI